MPLPASSRNGHMIAQRFKLGDRVGDAARSTVHHMTDMVIGDELSVIKLLDMPQPPEALHAWFSGKVQELQKLRHPHIASWRDAGWSSRERAFYLVRPYLPTPLFNNIPEDLPRTMRELVSALVHLHEKNVIHGHIAPSNLFLDRQGKTQLADVGTTGLREGLSLELATNRGEPNDFAAPEQLSGTESPLTLCADVYALGCVFVCLAQGISSLLDIEGAFRKCTTSDLPWKDTVGSMLEQDPRKRIRSAALAESFEETPEGLPIHSLALTNAARSKIKAQYANGGNTDWDSDYDDFEELSDYVKQDLGPDTGYQVRLYAGTGKEGDDIVYLLGYSLEYYCIPESNYLVAMDAFPLSRTEENLEYSLLYESDWRPVEYSPNRPDPLLAQLLQRLNVKLPATGSEGFGSGVSYGNYNQDKPNHFELGEGNADPTNLDTETLARQWLSALKQKEGRLRQSGLAYSRFFTAKGSKSLKFELKISLPDDMNWDDEADIMAYSQEYDQHEAVLVGRLVEAGPRHIEIRADTKDRVAVPKSGRLVPNLDAELSMLSRQRDAVRKLMAGEVHNPLLGRIVMGLSESQSTELADLDCCQPWLSGDKKEAVRRSLAALQLFLIQGPPGTGKTAVIAEIVLQILKQDPDARILVTSQSNIAVDNALSRIEEAATESDWQVPVMIRHLSTAAEKKGTGSQKYTPPVQADRWRQRTRADVVASIAEMKHTVVQGQSDVDLVQALTPNATANSELWNWAQEARLLLQKVQELQEDCDVARRQAVENFTTDSIQTFAETQAALAEIRNEAQSWLQKLSAYVQPGSRQGSGNTPPTLKRLEEMARNSDDLAARFQEWQHVRDRQKILEEWERTVGARDFLGFIESQARVVGTTCQTSGNSKKVQPGEFSWVIVDEAGRATLPETLIPIIKGTRCVMVGDIRQLPPTVKDMDEEKDEHDNLERSLFQTLVESGSHDPTRITSLSTQYRMHPAIGGLIGQVFYEDGLKPGKPKEDFQGKYGWLYADRPQPVRWLDTSALSNARETKRGHSYFNSGEAQHIFQLLADLDNRAPKAADPISVGIISGYKPQVWEIQKRVDPAKRNWSHLCVEIATVDAFQGRECDVILYSVARSNPQHQIGFLRDARRLNVALSRARALLIIVGDVPMMDRSRSRQFENPFREVLRYMREHTEDCCIVPATPDP